jgi:hypothetical protein
MGTLGITIVEAVRPLPGRSLRLVPLPCTRDTYVTRSRSRLRRSWIRTCGSGLPRSAR